LVVKRNCGVFRRLILSEYLIVLDIFVAPGVFGGRSVLPLAMFCGKTGFSQTKRMGLRDERLFHTPHYDG